MTLLRASDIFPDLTEDMCINNTKVIKTKANGFIKFEEDTLKQLFRDKYVDRFLKINNIEMQYTLPTIYRINVESLTLADNSKNKIIFPNTSVWVTFDKRVTSNLLGMDFLQLLNLVYLADTNKMSLNTTEGYNALVKYDEIYPDRGIFRHPEQLSKIKVESIKQELLKNSITSPLKWGK